MKYVKVFVLLFVEYVIKGKYFTMETERISRFNEEMRCRTKAFSIKTFRLLNEYKTSDLGRIVFKQLLRSSSSVAANFSSASRGRSEAEFYSKICIVVKK